MNGLANDWCILRTAAGSTLRLAETLSEAGFDVWTPAGPQLKKSIDAWDVKLFCKPRRQEEKLAPMVPSFVFAAADRLPELIELARSPALTYQVWDSEKRRMVTKGHPEFRLFRPFGQYTIIPELALAALRKAERTRKPRGEVKSFHVGDHVKLTDGAYAGLHGIVVRIEGKQAIVEFPKCGYIRNVKIGMWLLLDDEPTVPVCNPQSEQAPPARAA